MEDYSTRHLRFLLCSILGGVMLLTGKNAFIGLPILVIDAHVCLPLKALTAAVLLTALTCCWRRWIPGQRKRRHQEPVMTFQRLFKDSIKTEHVIQLHYILPTYDSKQLCREHWSWYCFPTVNIPVLKYGFKFSSMLVFSCKQPAHFFLGLWLTLLTWDLF